MLSFWEEKEYLGFWFFFKKILQTIYIHKNLPPAPSSSGSATWTSFPIELPIASSVSWVRFFKGTLCSCTQNATWLYSSCGIYSMLRTLWKAIKLLSYDQGSYSSTRSRSMISSNSNTSTFSPESRIFNSPIGFHNGLKVQATASTFNTLFVKNFPANRWTSIASWFETFTPPSLSSIRTCPQIF